MEQHQGYMGPSVR